MNYYSIEFGYELPADMARSRLYADGKMMVHINMGMPDRDDGMTTAIDLATRALDKLSIEHIHEYSWPGDGNFYLIVRCQMSKDILKKHLEQRGLRVNKFWPCDPNETKYRTLSPKETFEAVYKKRVADAETFLTTAVKLGIELTKAQSARLTRGFRAKDIKALAYLLKDNDE